MSDLCAFLRPVEITDDEKNLSYGGSAVTLSTGTYGSILTLLKEIEDKIAAVGGALATVHVHLDDDFRVRFWNTTTQGITWTDPNLAALLGYEASFSAASNWEASGAGYVTKQALAAHTPSHVWLPTFAVANQDFFRLDQGKAAEGTLAQNGQWSGYAQGTGLREREFEFMYEAATNVAETFETDSYTLTNTYYPQQERCFERFAYGARAAHISASGNTSRMGFYYLHDRSSYADSSTFGDTTMPATMTSGGVRFDDAGAADADEWCFCNLKPGSLAKHDAGLPAGRQYYNVRFTVVTATAPTWDN